MVVPSITDVTMAALCPGKDKCSLAIYLSGAQQVIVGLGSLLVMPMLGNLSDTYGRKIMLTIPISLSIIPLLVLACSMTKYYFYAYYVLKTTIAMATQGSVSFLAYAYVADIVQASKRASVFGIVSGVAFVSAVLGNFSARFLSTSTAFQVAAAISVISLVYMRLFLSESLISNSICVNKSSESECLLQKAPAKKWLMFRNLLSLGDSISLLRTSPSFLKAAVIAFFYNVSEFGLYNSLMYCLKAQFHFNKDQFADLLIISGIAGSISQLIIMPVFCPFVGEARLLPIGLFFTFAHILLYSVAWAPWVPYAAAMMCVVSVFALPCLRSIASKLTGPDEQGKVQGCITGISSFAGIVAPFAFTPLTALFLSDNSPFYFPGFSIFCSAIAAMIAVILSMMIGPAPAINSIISSSDPAQTLV
ncbi:hippocampus abundant transcript-like protein 1-like [Dorcoceras hygrometricum]|uniref:Hippocampus abundant transcript-like protein 1-like n=1 Tax=Dorcoceras hygrometricum TaxID=472368 RepID=A0A2Z7ALP2_9LAMI|nr:hippocampus abundant transcript-like protein 1-like [Dorcoceras hygrometricum]